MRWSWRDSPRRTTCSQADRPPSTCAAYGPVAGSAGNPSLAGRRDALAPLVRVAPWTLTRRSRAVSSAPSHSSPAPLGGARKGRKGRHNGRTVWWGKSIRNDGCLRRCGPDLAPRTRNQRDRGRHPDGDGVEMSRSAWISPRSASGSAAQSGAGPTRQQTSLVWPSFVPPAYPRNARGSRHVGRVWALCGRFPPTRRDREPSAAAIGVVSRPHSVIRIRSTQALSLVSIVLNLRRLCRQPALFFQDRAGRVRAHHVRPILVCRAYAAAPAAGLPHRGSKGSPDAGAAADGPSSILDRSGLSPRVSRSGILDQSSNPRVSYLSSRRRARRACPRTGARC